MQVTIYGGESPGSGPLDNGYVQVTKYGLPGKICVDDWSDKAADVICRQSGFVGGVGLKYRVFTPSTYWLIMFRCRGNETSLQDCDILPPQDSAVCSSSREIGVLCYNRGGTPHWGVVILCVSSSVF